MFSICLITQEYRAVAHHMDRHRRHFTFRPHQACQFGTFCHKLYLHIALTPEMFRAQFDHSLSRSLSWNS
ncbi:protein YoaL [Citrobacter freundii]